MFLQRRTSWPFPAVRRDPGLVTAGVASLSPSGDSLSRTVSACRRGRGRAASGPIHYPSWIVDGRASVYATRGRKGEATGNRTESPVSRRKAGTRYIDRPGTEAARTVINRRLSPHFWTLRDSIRRGRVAFLTGDRVQRGGWPDIPNHRSRVPRPRSLRRAIRHSGLRSVARRSAPLAACSIIPV